MRPQRRSKKPLVIGLIVLGILIAAGLFVWANSGNEAQISETYPREQKQLPEYQTYDGSQMSFRYKSVYHVEKLPAKNGDLELLSLTANTNYEKHMTAAVSELPGGQLTNNSAYNLRRTDTVNYKSHELAVDGGTAIVWVKQDGFEQTAFIQKGNKVAMFALSTTGTIDDLQSEMVALLYSFRWKG